MDRMSEVDAPGRIGETTTEAVERQRREAEQAVARGLTANPSSRVLARVRKPQSSGGLPGGAVVDSALANLRRALHDRRLTVMQRAQLLNMLEQDTEKGLRP